MRIVETHPVARERSRRRLMKSARKNMELGIERQKVRFGSLLLQDEYADNTCFAFQACYGCLSSHQALQGSLACLAVWPTMLVSSLSSFRDSVFCTQISLVLRCRPNLQPQTLDSIAITNCLPHSRLGFYAAFYRCHINRSCIEVECTGIKNVCYTSYRNTNLPE